MRVAAAVACDSLSVSATVTCSDAAVCWRRIALPVGAGARAGTASMTPRRRRAGRGPLPGRHQRNRAVDDRRAIRRRVAPGADEPVHERRADGDRSGGRNDDEHEPPRRQPEPRLPRLGRAREHPLPQRLGRAQLRRAEAVEQRSAPLLRRRPRRVAAQQGFHALAPDHVTRGHRRPSPPVFAVHGSGASSTPSG